MGNASTASHNFGMGSFKTGRKGQQRDETHRFLCASVLCACCGRGGNCLLLSCQQCSSKVLSIQEATDRQRPEWEIRTQMSLFLLPQHQHHIHTKKQNSNPASACIWTHTTQISHINTHTQTERLWFEWYEWEHSTFPVTLNTEYFIGVQNQVSLLQKTRVHKQGNYRKTDSLHSLSLST